MLSSSGYDDLPANSGRERLLPRLLRPLASSSDGVDDQIQDLVFRDLVLRRTPR